jgi:hypothetical protein
MGAGLEEAAHAEVGQRHVFVSPVQAAAERI